MVRAQSALKTFKKNGMLSKDHAVFLNEEKKLKTLSVLSEFEHDPVSSSQRLKKLDRVFYAHSTHLKRIALSCERLH